MLPTISVPVQTKRYQSLHHGHLVDDDVVAFRSYRQSTSSQHARTLAAVSYLPTKSAYQAYLFQPVPDLKHMEVWL
jgi:hypothetical protein